MKQSDNNTMKQNDRKKTEMRFYSEDKTLELLLGTKGTTLREQYESEVNFFMIGEVIRQARLSKNLTQEQLGKMIGVKRAQVSRIEKGRNLTLTTISRIFKAMNIPTWLHMSGIGKVAI